jgi:glycosyltransferase involved in cell wall biosynthesis
MNVLMVNKFYFEFGGADIVMFRIAEELERIGHRVVPFSMEHPLNKPSEYGEFFVPNISYRDSGSGPFTKVAAGLRSIYSPIAARNLGRLLDAAPPINVAHLHNFNYEITPSILPVLAKRGIPVVWTLHDPQIVCPYHRLYDYRTHEICEDCTGGRFYRAPLRGCIQGSRTKSAIGAAEAYLYRWTGAYERHVSLFTTPSRFLREKVIAMGAPVPPERIIHIPNGVDVRSITPDIDDDGYLLFVGRISGEKGIRVLLEAIRQTRDVKLVVVGEGPEEAEAKAFVAIHGLGDRVRFTGYKTGDELARLVRRARANVVPSTWQENSPMSILESFAYGTPVAASDAGGIPELIDHGTTGLLVPAGDAEALAGAMQTLSDDPVRARRMGAAARRRVEEQHDWKDIVGRFVEIYRTAGENRGKESVSRERRGRN